jgi:hypothetical protein
MPLMNRMLQIGHSSQVPIQAYLCQVVCSLTQNISIVAVKIGRERSSGLITKEVADGIELLPSVDTRFLQAIY